MATRRDVYSVARSDRQGEIQKPHAERCWSREHATKNSPPTGRVASIIRRQVRAVDDSEPLYHRIAELWFENAERIDEALSSPEGQDATVDLPNFTTGGATFFVSEAEA